MKWFIRILLAIVLIGGWVVAARCVHVIHSIDAATGQNRFGLLPKARWRFDDTYVDVRPWKAGDLAAHAELVKHIARSGKADLLRHIPPKDFTGDLSAWLIETTTHPPATTQSG